MYLKPYPPQELESFSLRSFFNFLLQIQFQIDIVLCLSSQQFHKDPVLKVHIYAQIYIHKYVNPQGVYSIGEKMNKK